MRLTVVEQNIIGIAIVVAVFLAVFSVALWLT